MSEERAVEGGRAARIRAEDALLYEIARDAGPERLTLGEAAAKLLTVGGVGALGFSTRDGYAKERLSRTGRWVDESSLLAKRLEELPRIREALRQRRISWSMAELLARRATPETEEELLGLVLTPGVTVHAMRDSLDHRDDEEVRELDPAERRCTIEEVAPLEQALFVEATRMLVEHQCGGSDFDWFEYLVAEGVATAPELLDYHVLAAIDDELQKGRARVEEGVVRRAEAEELAEPDLPPNPEPSDAIPDPEPLPDDPLALDALLQRIALRLAARDLELGRLASDFFRSAGWRDLGYATDTQYCRERLGMSRTAVWQRITLARRCERLPALAEALATGDIGFEAAALVARVASPGTERAWIGRAGRRTFKHLREEVRAREVDRRLGQRGPLWPPADDEMREHEDFEREVLSGDTIAEVLDQPAERPSDRGRGAVGAEIRIEDTDGDEPSPVAVEAPIQISGSSLPPELAADIAHDIAAALAAIEARGRTRSKGEARIRIRTNEEVARFYRAARERYRTLGQPGTLLMALCTWFWATWIHEVRAKRSKYDAIHRRDRFTCASPGCDRRLCTLHHIVFRMLGGDERWTNLLTLCETCHLENVHARGTLRVSGEAPYGLTFTFGKRPVFTVRGRDKRAA